MIAGPGMTCILKISGKGMRNLEGDSSLAIFHCERGNAVNISRNISLFLYHFQTAVDPVLCRQIVWLLKGPGMDVWNNVRTMRGF